MDRREGRSDPDSAARLAGTDAWIHPMSDSMTAKGGSVDVTRVMDAIREDIRRRHDGLPIDQALVERLQDLADNAEFDAGFLGPLLGGEGGWNVNPDYRIVTHRVGVAAAAVVTLKRLIRFVARLYTDPLVERQAQINLYLLRGVEALLAETSRLRRALGEVRREDAQR
jgi:hypothetical protein